MRFVITIALAALLPMPARAESAAEEKQSTAEEISQQEAGPEGEFAATLTVTAKRLRDEPEPWEKVPAHVTVLDGNDIARSGAWNLQDLLALEPGVVLYDQVGNDVSKTLDLRGFASGTGAKVFLDGVPLNQLRNNRVSLELVPLAALERVEITRGSTATLAGGGSEAGVINLWTRRPDGFAGSLSAAAGDFGSTRYGGNLQHRLGRVDLDLQGSWYGTDGFRENADGDARHLSAVVGFDLSEDRRLVLSFADGGSDFGAPGALTQEEAQDDPTRSPFNTLDFLDERLRLASVSYLGDLPGNFRLSANGFYRDLGSQILSTGRAAAVFGGFFSDAGSQALGTTVQVSQQKNLADSSNDLSLGVEWLDGETEALGFFTPPTEPGEIDRTFPGSSNKADRRTQALFIQDSWKPSSKWSLVAGARYDRDSFVYSETVPDPTNASSRSFDEVSLRAGATWQPRARVALYAAYGEAFLPPSVEQLFAFPLFGSNPALEPQDSTSAEVGVRWFGNGSKRANLTFFQVDTRNEIVFDPDSALGLFGANVNAGETRRSGLEADFRGRLAWGVDLFASLTLVDAQFRNGSNEGRDVPLVPGERFSLGFDLPLPVGLDFRVDGLWVSEQVLANDEANDQQRLDSYTVLNARLSWTFNQGRQSAGSTGAEGLEVFVEARNLLDETFATRGIYAFDFSTFRQEVFLTPAPDRRVMGGVRWGF